MNSLVIIVGPTGIGKSRLALRLAQTFDGEIVSADSRQVYRYMDIGTAKPTLKELSFVPHHLINIVSPDESFSLAQYQQLAYQAIDDIQQRHKLPLLVGGSGLYIWSVLEGWRIPRVPPDLEFRHRLEERAAEAGPEALYQELVRVAPVAARGVDRQNLRRVIRALEVRRFTKTPFPQPQNKEAPPFTILVAGLTADRKELYSRIDLRVDEMIRQGLVEEVKRLVNKGYGLNLPAMSGIGYRQIGLYLKGELTLASAIPQIKSETHRFVRHQYNWFRLKDDRIKWFDIQGNTDSEITTLLTKFLRRSN